MGLFLCRFNYISQGWLAERGLRNCDLHAYTFEWEARLGKSQGLVLILKNFLDSRMQQEILNQLREDLVVYV